MIGILGIRNREVAGHVLEQVACQLAHSGWRLKDESVIQLSKRRQRDFGNGR